MAWQIEKSAGGTDNHENSLITHDRELAQAYYEEWERLWGAVDLDRICNPYDVYLPVVVRDWPPTPMPTVFVYCTPPPCNFDEGEVYHCPSECPGGCGTICATVTPAPISVRD